MPTSVSDLTNIFNLKVSKTVKWGTPIEENHYGIYIVSLNENIDFLPHTNSTLSVDDNQISVWLKNASEISLYNKKVTKEELKKHLINFWLPDETIIYIGKAERQFLTGRINQYYHHYVGKKSPHKGGYWAKLLTNLNDFYIHLIPTDDSHKIEEEMLKCFINNVSNESKSNLIDKDLCLPFANLQLRSGVVKKHGLLNHYQ